MKRMHIDEVVRRLIMDFGSESEKEHVDAIATIFANVTGKQTVNPDTYAKVVKVGKLLKSLGVNQ